MRIKRLFFCSIACCLCTACGTLLNNYQSEQLTSLQYDSLQHVYHALHDSLEQTFQAMVREDEHRLDNMKHLLQEMEKEGGYSSDSIRSLYAQVQQLYDVCCDADMLAQVRAVKAYDSASYATSENIIRFTDEQPGLVQNPVASLLVDQIIGASNSMLLYRLQYDRLSQEYNHFLEEHRGIISSLDSSGTPVRRRAVFGLMSGNAHMK